MCPQVQLTCSVVRLIQQFCKEHALTRTLQTLQEETQISLNIVDDMQAFLSDIFNGKWDAVLKTVSTIQLPQNKLIDLYEQVRTVATV
jgi:WD40 repeat-containing protein SMU1